MAESAAAQLVPVIAAQSSARAGLARYASLAATTRVAAMGEQAWYDDQKVAAMAKAIAAPVQAAQRQTAALTDAYLARVTTAMGVKRAAAAPVGPVDVSALRGIPNPLVYQRLGSAYRYQRSIGKGAEEAQSLIVQRAGIMADTDATLAMRAQAQKYMGRRKIARYRRVIQPERSAGGTCGLCAAASHRMYFKADLLPIHGRCNCEVMPAIGSNDPAYELNDADLTALYGAAGSTGRQDLARIRVTVHHHGELGPVLGVSGQHFTGPAAIAAH
jgi:hypothetical protein